jgi:hypothetical protein
MRFGSFYDSFFPKLRDFAFRYSKINILQTPTDMPRHLTPRHAHMFHEGMLYSGEDLGVDCDGRVFCKREMNSNGKGASAAALERASAARE